MRYVSDDEYEKMSYQQKLELCVEHDRQKRSDQFFDGTLPLLVAFGISVWIIIGLI
jgi:hypothetical protein